MFLEESPEQQQLRAELRRYYAEPPHRRGARRAGRGRRGRRGLEPGRAPGGQGRLARYRLAERVRRPGSAGRPTSSSSSTRRGGPARPSPSSRSTRSGRPSCATAPRSRSRSSSRRSSPASSTSPSATPSRGRHRPGVAAHPGGARRRRVRRQRRQDLHLRCRPGRLRLAGRAAPTPTCRSTRASPSCACPRQSPASSGRSSTRWAGSPPPRPSTTTCASRWPTASATRTRAGA